MPKKAHASIDAICFCDRFTVVSICARIINIKEVPNKENKRIQKKKL